MKPIPLLEYLLRNSTDRGDAILDTFCGSGSTLVAAHQSGRIGYGIEIDPKYCDVTVRRLEAVTGKKAVKISE